jgi:hypothetical protein
LAVGVICVVLAAAMFALKTPQAIRSMNTTVRNDAYITDSLGRVLTGGASLGVPNGVQVAALSEIPRNSDYAVLLPPTVEAAAAYGINSIAYAVTVPYLQYLLLPARLTTPDQAHFIICWGCDTAPWDHRTTWLWKNDQGQAIGEVRR